MQTMTKDSQSQFHIQRFNPENSKEHCLWLLVGPRNTRKIVLLMALLYHTHHRYDMGMAMTATESTVDTFKANFTTSVGLHRRVRLFFW